MKTHAPHPEPAVQAAVPRSYSLRSQPRAWTWVAISLLLLMGLAISWNDFRDTRVQRQTFSSLRNFRQARVDLAEGFLHCALSGEPESPFDRAAGLALIEQAGHASDVALEPEPEAAPDPEQAQLARAFHRSVTELIELLREGGANAARDVRREVRLRIAYHQAESLAQSIDLHVQGRLRDLSHAHQSSFRWYFLITSALVGAVCTGAFLSERSRNRARDALRRSEARYRTMAETSPDPIVITRERRLVYINPSGLQLLGASSPEDYLGKLPEAILHPDSHQSALERHEKHSRGERLPLHEQKFMRVDGTVVDVEVSAAVFEDETGTNVQATLRDITERKLAEQAIAERLSMEKRLSRIAATVPGVLYSFLLRADGSACAPYGSPAMKDLCGLAPEEVATDIAPFFALIEAGDQAAFHQSIAHSARDLCPWRHEFRMRHPSKGVIWIDGHSIPERLADGGTLWQGILVDITERKNAEAAIAESLERFRLLARSTSDAVFDWDFQTRSVWWSDGIRTLFGHALEESLAEPSWWLDHVHPEDRPRMQHAHERAYGHPEGRATCEYRFLRADGTYADIYSRMRLMRNAQGEPVRMIGALVDVSELKVAASQATRSAERLRLAMQVARMADWEWDMRSGAIKCDQRLVDMISGPGSPMIKRSETFLSFVHPEDVPGVARAVEATQRRGQDYRATMRVVWPNASVHWLEAHGTVIRDDAGQPIRIFGVTTDITQRRLAEQSIAESREQFRQVVENIPEVFWMNELATQRVLYVSPAYEQVWGRSRESLYVAPGEWLDAVHSEDREWVHEAFQKQGLSGGYDIEYRVVRPDGSVRWIHDKASPVRNHKGEITRMTGVAADITERRQLEEQLRQGQKLEAIGTLAGGIAHDFNNILTAVIGYADLAAMEIGSNHPALSSLQQILVAADRAAHLVQQILAFGRHQPNESQALFLPPIIEESMGLLRATLPANAVLSFRQEADAPAVFANETQIQQVIINLCTNAWHALEGNAGRIEIELKAACVDGSSAAPHRGMHPGSYTCLSVHDTGCGMDADTRARIFEPFFTTKDQGQGTGLGLSVVHGIVSAYHGTIVLESQPGAGTTFYVYLPASEAPTPTPERSAGSRAGAPRHAQHIMHVDDEEVLVEMVSRALRKRGYEVSGFTSPQAALAAFHAAPDRFHLVLTDMNMPLISGLELAAEILAVRPKLPIVLASGFLTEDLSDQARELGIGHLIYKPTNLDGILQAIQRVLPVETPAPGHA